VLAGDDGNVGVDVSGEDSKGSDGNAAVPSSRRLGLARIAKQ
jgi:hypothetical protein